jgi:hypothetical protein
MTVEVWYDVHVTRYSGGSESTSYYSTKARSPSSTFDITAMRSTFVAGRLANPGIISKHLWGAGKTRGPRDLTNGYLDLNNGDAGLDAYIGYALQNRRIRIRRYTSADVNNGSDVFIGTQEQPLVDDEFVQLLFREPAFILDTVLQRDFYGGTNALPNGLDGATDLQGKPKPLAYGVVRNVSPVLVNTSRLIYQAHASAIYPSTMFMGSLGTIAAPNVYDRRVALTSGILRAIAEFNAGASSQSVSINAATDNGTVASTASYSTGQACTFTFSAAPGLSGGGLLLSTAYYYIRVLTGTTVSFHPTSADASANTNKILFASGGTSVVLVVNSTLAGHYDWCNDNDGFFIRLGATPVGKVTMDFTNYCDIQETFGSPPYDTTPNGIDNLMLKMFAGIPMAGSLLGVTFNGVPLDGSGFSTYADGGIYLTEEVTRREALETVAASLGVAWPTRVNTADAHSWYLDAQQLIEPSDGTPVLTIDQGNILNDGEKARFAASFAPTTSAAFQLGG